MVLRTKGHIKVSIMRLNRQSTSSSIKRKIMTPSETSHAFLILRDCDLHRTAVMNLCVKIQYSLCYPHGIEHTNTKLTVLGFARDDLVGANSLSLIGRASKASSFIATD